MSQLREIEKELLKSIPILEHMGVKLLTFDAQEVVVSAQLDNHFNYEGTAFGGSLNTIALLPCYLMARKISLEQTKVINSLVIQDSEIKYLRPVRKDFIARCLRPDVTDFCEQFERRGSARLSLESHITYKDESEELVRFKGRFVARS